MSTAWPAAPPWGWWIRIRACGRAKRLPCDAGGQEHRGGRGGLPDADGADVALDVLHRVVDGEETGDLPARGVDVDADVLVGVLALQVEQLGGDQVGDGVVDRRAQEDDAFLEQPGVEVERPLAPVGLLDHRRDEVVLDGLGHDCDSSSGSSAGASAAGSGNEISRGFPSSSNTVAWSTRNCRAFPLDNSERTASRPWPRSISLLNWAGFALNLSANLTISASTSSSLATSSSWAATALRGQVGFHGLGRLDPHVVDEWSSVWPRGRQVLLDRGSLVVEAVDEVVEPALHLLLDQRLGDVDVDRPPTVSSRLSRTASWPWIRRTVSIRLRMSASQVLQGVELAGLLDPLVGGFGEDLALDLLDQNLEGDLLAGPLAPALGEDVVEPDDVAGRLPLELARRAWGHEVGARPRRGSRWPSGPGPPRRGCTP